MHHKLAVVFIPAKLYLQICFALLAHLTLGLGQSQEIALTFMLPAGRTECFYQSTVRDWRMEVEYQVIGGGGLDVGFTLISPSGYRVISDFRKSDAIHTMDPTEDGDYRMCFDNSFSQLSEKIVFFAVNVHHPDGDTGGDKAWLDMATPENLVEYKLDDIRVTMGSMYRALERSRQMQAQLRAFEARDRYLLEDNLWRVSFWSSLNLLVMLTVAVTQIYMVRRLFDDRKRVAT